LCQLPARYHRRALPVPKLFWLKNKSTIQQLPPRFFSLLAQLGKQGNSLLFVPKIEWLAPLAVIIQQKLPDFSVESVHAKDQTRTTKVQKMRNGETKILLTTTILERGVTFKEVSVVVLFADNRNFSKTALIQIAGRVDRKGKSKNGAVYFVAKRNSPEMRQAIMEIKKQNNLAQKRGLLQ
jgi:competence protein ComFA